MSTPLPVADTSPDEDDPPAIGRERIAEIMYCGVPESENALTAGGSAAGESLSCLGLAGGQLVSLKKLRLPSLLARAFGKDYVSTPDLVCAMLEDTARELRFMHRAIGSRDDCNSIVMDDVKETLRTATARIEVAAELHTRMLVALAMFHHNRTLRRVAEARRAERAKAGAP